MPPTSHTTRRRSPLHLLLSTWMLLVATTAASAAGDPHWWSPFRDPALDTVMQAAAPTTPAAEQNVVEDYIAVRVGEVRGMLAARLFQAASHQQAVLMNAPVDAQRQAGLQTLARRIQAIESASAALNAGLDDAVAALAQRSGMAPFHLRAVLAGGQPSGQEQLMVPAVQTQPPDAATVSVLRSDLAERLQALQAWAQHVARIGQVLETRKAELRARVRRQELGAEDELETLEAYQQLVVDSDALAQASGRLALAWAQWLQGGGGTRSLTASAL